MAFAVNVMENFDHIRKGDDEGSYIFSIENGRRTVGKRTIGIEVETDGEHFLRAKTAGYENMERLRQREQLWEEGAENSISSTDAASANVTTGTSQQGGEMSSSASNQSASLSEYKGSENSDTSKENDGNSRFSAEERAERAGRVLSEVQGQKRPGTSYDTAELDMDDLGETRFSVGERRRTEMENRLKKVRPDLTEEQRDALFDYLGTLTKPNGDNDTKLQNATFNWFAKGAIRIPEDMDKVRQAVKVAERFGADTGKYDNPMELIDTFSERTGTDNPIDPDTVPTLTNKVDYGNGITVYDVDESEESRQWMRKIIDTHLGKDRNPWCLLAADKDGNFYEDSEEYWHDTYNKYPKRVAFKDGRLVAFFASNGEPTWWDTQDSPHSGIPVTRKMDDGSGRTATYEYDEGTGRMSEPHNIHKGNKQNGTYEEWHDNGRLKSRATFKDGEYDGAAESWYENGQLKIRGNYKEGKQDGAQETFYPNGQMEDKWNARMGYYDGVFEGWYENGQQRRRVTYKDGHTVGVSEWWYPNGVMERRDRYNMDGKRDGVAEEWYENGVMRERTEYKDGKLTGISESWSDYGQLRRRQSYKNGMLDGNTVRWGIRGNIDCLRQYKNGVNDGLELMFDDNGTLSAYYEYRDGTEVGLGILLDPFGRESIGAREKDKNGYTVREFSREEAERLYAEKVAEVNAMLAEQGIPTKVSETKFSAEERVNGNSGHEMTEAEQLERDNERYNSDLDAFSRGEGYSPVRVGTPSAVLRACGLNDTEMYIKRKVLRDHLNKHNLTVDDIRDLPKALQNPLLVYEWGKTAKSMVIITNIEHGNDRITVAVKVERGGEIVEVNEIASVHAKEANRFLSDMAKTEGEEEIKRKFRWVGDKEKALEWLGLTPSSPKEVGALTEQELSVAKVIQDFDNPTLPDENVNFSAEARELSDAGTRETVSDIENPEGDTRFSAEERVNAADEARERLGVELTPDDLASTSTKHGAMMKALRKATENGAIPNMDSDDLITFLADTYRTAPEEVKSAIWETFSESADPDIAREVEQSLLGVFFLAYLGEELVPAAYDLLQGIDKFLHDFVLFLQGGILLPQQGELLPKIGVLLLQAGHSLHVFQH